MSIFDPLRAAGHRLVALSKSVARLEESVAFVREAVGRIEGRQVAANSAATLRDAEFKVTSQWGEDGILQFLLRRVAVARPVFVEFGVETYIEANTRFLLTNHGWSGLVIDGSETNVSSIRRDPIYWRHNLKAVCALVTRENINELITSAGLSGEIGLLSVDIDGNDYWVWEAINVIEPTLVVVEYNALFGPTRAVTVPYDSAFVRTEKHHSNLYYGASLAALVGLGERKGYALVGTNSAGNNAFFVRCDRLPAGLPELDAVAGFTPRSFREGRDANGKLTFLCAEEEAAVALSLPLVEV